MKNAVFIGGMILLVFAALLLSKTSFVKGVTREGFASYYLENAKPTDSRSSMMSSFDGVKLTCPDSTSSWKCGTPNEPLNGPAFKVGTNDLFMFKNNVSKPECCPSSFSSDAGCVCTSPEQRQLLASRGGNKTGPEDAP